VISRREAARRRPLSRIRAPLGLVINGARSDQEWGDIPSRASAAAVHCTEAVEEDVRLLARRVATRLRRERPSAGRPAGGAAVTRIREQHDRSSVLAVADRDRLVVAAEDPRPEAVVIVRRNVRDLEVSERTRELQALRRGTGPTGRSEPSAAGSPRRPRRCTPLPPSASTT
jgi:hypothetical protein